MQKQGGPDALLHGSRKRTQQIDAEIYFQPQYQGISNGYRISLTPTADNRLIFSREETWIDGHYTAKAIPLGTAHDEAKLRDDQQAGAPMCDPQCKAGGSTISTTRATPLL